MAAVPGLRFHGSLKLRENSKITVCAAHVAPVYLDTRATVAKACGLIAEASEKGADLVVFPESYVPGFPLWTAVAPPYRNHDFFERFVAASIRVPGPEIADLCRAARDAQIMVSMGISESTDVSVGCLWNSNLLIDKDGSILNHHRKLVPTFFEKLIWANGDGVGLRVTDTALGRIGMLICGENTNPLARYALIAMGEQVHMSSYPPIWPTHQPSANDAYDLTSAIRIRAGAHSFEAKAFNIVASSILDDTALDALKPLGDEAMDIITGSPRGASMILNPQGNVIAETASREDELLVADIDLQDCVVPKQFHDVAGYYNRFDIFDFAVDRSPRDPARLPGNDGPRSYDFDMLNSRWARADAAE